MLDFKEVIALVTLLGALVAFAWGFARWVVARDEKVRQHVDDRHGEVDKKLEVLHGRINDTRQAMLTKDDLNDVRTHVSRVETLIQGVNGRIDDIARWLVEQKR